MASTTGQRQTMDKTEILRILKQEKAALAQQYGVVSLALFGSAARDQVGPDSDVDILVQFDGPATSKRYFGVQFHLEDLLGHPVDLVTDKALRPELRPFIEAEAMNV
jgi:hypothetical protein